jgi:predicted PurR-regulated permease PerM
MSDPLQPAPRPTPVKAAETPALSSLLGVVVAVVVVMSLYFGRSVLLPITLASLLSFVLAPLVRLLRRLWLGRVGSVLVAALAAIGLVVVLGGIIGSQVMSLSADVPLYRATILQKVGTVERFATHGITDLVSSFTRGVQSVAGDNKQPTTNPITGQKEVKPLLVQVQPEALSPLLLAERIVSPVLSPLASVGIIFIITIFLLLQREDLRDRMIRLFGSGDLHRTTAAIDDAAARLSRYFLTQLGINTAFGIVIGAGLALIGVPAAILWGVMAALLRFVPYVGSFIAAIIPIALAAASEPSWLMAIYTAALFVVVESVVGQAVEPLMYGSSTGLSPFAVVVAAIFWTWLWGPIGLIISTPITLCLVVLGRHVPKLEFLDVLLGDRPALSPVESFYQRMLAGDPDEAQAQAETLLRETTLSSYYDDVAMKGLALAVTDSERGVLTPERLRAIGAAMAGLIDELDEYDDFELPEERADGEADETPAERRLARRRLAERPAPVTRWSEGAPVLCIAGRGPLDDAASAMLAQLLGKHGIGARVVPHGAASRGAIASLDLNGVEMVCVTYLGIDPASPSLRYLLARLRRRLPKAPLLVGMGAQGEAILDDPAAAAAVGADIYVTSLRAAVKACLEVAGGDVIESEAA